MQFDLIHYLKICGRGENMIGKKAREYMKCHDVCANEFRVNSAAEK